MYRRKGTGSFRARKERHWIQSRTWQFIDVQYAACWNRLNTRQHREPLTTWPRHMLCLPKQDYPIYSDPVIPIYQCKWRPSKSGRSGCCFNLSTTATVLSGTMEELWLPEYGATRWLDLTTHWTTDAERQNFIYVDAKKRWVLTLRLQDKISFAI